ERALLPPPAGLPWLGLTAVLLVAVAGLADRTSLLARIPLFKPVPVLLDRAEDVRRSLGYTDVPVDQYSSLAYDRAYLEWGEHHGSGETHWRELADGRPAAVLFWYRTRPVAIISE